MKRRYILFLILFYTNTIVFFIEVFRNAQNCCIKKGLHFWKPFLLIIEYK